MEASAAATRGATLPPMLWPTTKIRSGSTPSWLWRRRTAATACGTYSSVIVKSGASAAWTCAYVTLSNRSAATPRLARPHARSLSGLFGPLVSSRSNGPPPLSNTTPGACPVPDVCPGPDARPPSGVCPVPGVCSALGVCPVPGIRPAPGVCSAPGVPAGPDPRPALGVCPAPGVCAALCGRVSVPGTARGPEPIMTSRSVKRWGTA